MYRIYRLYNINIYENLYNEKRKLPEKVIERIGMS